MTEITLTIIWPHYHNSKSIRTWVNDQITNKNIIFIFQHSSETTNVWYLKFKFDLYLFYQCTVFLCLSNALVHKTHPFPLQKNLGEILVPIYRIFSKTFTAEILVQTAKSCLPQIKYLLIRVFLINFRQENVKLVLLKSYSIFCKRKLAVLWMQEVYR